MSQDFDPLHIWLGIPPQDQPPNHYRLLGLQLFESNPKVVEMATDRVMAHLRTFQTGEHGHESQKLLNQIASARICLLSPEKKAAYDQELRSKAHVGNVPELVAPAAGTVVAKPMATTDGPVAAPAIPEKNLLILIGAVAGGGVLFLLLIVVAALMLMGGNEEVALQPPPKKNTASKNPRQNYRPIALEIDPVNVDSATFGARREVNSPLSRYAYHFTGRDSIEISNTRGMLRLGRDSFTAELWFKPDRVGGDKGESYMLMGNWASDSHPKVTSGHMGWFVRREIKPLGATNHRVTYRFAYSLSDGSMRNFYYYHSEPTSQAERWHHLAMTAESVEDGGSRVALHLDGRSITQHTVPKEKISESASPNNLFLGVPLDHSDGILFRGQIHGFRLSQAVLYSSSDSRFTLERAFSYNNQTLALLNFGQGTGLQLEDLSGNGRVGTAHGGQWVRYEETDASVSDNPSQ